MADKTTKEKNWFAKHKVLTVILVLVAFSIIGSAAGGGSKSSNGKTTTEQKPAAKPKVDITAFYGQVQSGMTKDEVVVLAAKDPGSCTETEMQGLGKYEYCNWYGSLGENVFVSVTFKDGKVDSKAKTGF